MSHPMAVCLWFDGAAEEAATFYAATFPDSRVDKVTHAPGDYPAGQQGDVLTVEFTVCGTPFVGLNGGGGVAHGHAISFQIFTDTQAETDRLWDAIVGNGGKPNACSWCSDRWGVNWQIVPRVLPAALSHPDPDVRARAFTAMMGMTRIDIAGIEAAVRGDAA
ncbi:VOC family protein [Sphingomonas sp. RP10(2022)]|uniref:VOC family protein n=1 Tax=Sphingomonas liriopis TaxID=2949094 RepID=A0A9X2KQ88_9SPHN|nr:VOC family protein [Sphingomonas liriopis]MCP3734682.1 VOC family protein [Sphingomonas liriopis]